MGLDQLTLGLACETRLTQATFADDAATRPQAYKLVLAIHDALR